VASFTGILVCATSFFDNFLLILVNIKKKTGWRRGGSVQDSVFAWSVVPQNVKLTGGTDNCLAAHPS
jgi:hypothetical protein